jgi:chromate transporter
VTPGAPEPAAGSLRELAAYFLRLGTLGFGGPIALAGYMQRDLVEQRRWISKQDYVEGLALFKAKKLPEPVLILTAGALGLAFKHPWSPGP